MKTSPALLVLVALASCRDAGPPPASTTAPSGQPAPSAASSGSAWPEVAPVACTTDRDCPSLSCGPCAPGTVVTKGGPMVHCYRNPCPERRAVCSPAHVCVVK